MNTRLLIVLLILFSSLFSLHTSAQENLVSNVKFRSIGPSVMSGRVVDVDVCPDDPTHFYVAYASGGLWVTYNNGQSFTPIFDHEEVMTIGDIAVDWKHGETIWIGTGENNSSRSSYAGLGMYKSTDKGKTWQRKGLDDSHHIGRIILHPDDPNTVYVAVLGHLFSTNDERGVYKTTDGGITWKKTLFVDNATGAIDLIMDPMNPRVLFASMWHRIRYPWNFEGNGKTSGIYKSVDGGDTWTLVSTKESGFPTGDGVGRIGLSIYAGDMEAVMKDNQSDSSKSPKHVMHKFIPRPMYAIVDNQDHREKKKETKKELLTKDILKSMTKESFLALKDSVIDVFLKKNEFDEEYSAERIKNMIKADSIKVSSLLDYLDDANDDLFETEIKGAEVYRSDDAGSTWKKTHEGYLDNVFNTYGYYFGQIRIAPNNPDKIYIYGVPFLKSQNGGKTFKSIDAANTHGDYHALWLDPNKDGHMIIGNDGGINITYDDGKTYYKANTPAVGQFYSINVDNEKPYNVYGGLQDNGVWYGPSTNKENTGWHEEGEYPFKRIMGGDGMQVAIDTRDNTTVYTGYQFGNYFRVNRNTGENKYITPKHKLGERPLRWNWQAPIWLSKHNQDIVYFGSNKFHRAMNKGNDFITLSDDLTLGGKKGNVPFGTITTITESPLKFGLLYCGTDDGQFYSSIDAGFDWAKMEKETEPDPLHNLYVSRIVASAFDISTVYVSGNGKIFDDFGSYLYKSKFMGYNWERIGLDLPHEPINVIREDPKNKNILYVGTDHGVYVSLNKGKNFMKMTGNFPNVAVHDLVVHPREKDLVVGTHGRSIYIADVSELEQLNDTLMAKEIYVFKINSIKYGEHWGKAQNAWTEPHSPKHDIAFYQKEKGISTIRIKTEKDLTLREIKDTCTAGLNYYSYDMAIDSLNLSKYQTWVNENKNLNEDEKKLVLADSKKYYLKPGKYFIEIETSKGIKSKQELLVTAKESKEGHRGLPVDRD
ncbi:MAG: glycosyl hydrolase [Bacteroidota bacterium]